MLIVLIALIALILALPLLYCLVARGPKDEPTPDEPPETADETHDEFHKNQDNSQRPKERKSLDKLIRAAELRKLHVPPTTDDEDDTDIPPFPAVILPYLIPLPMKTKKRRKSKKSPSKSPPTRTSSIQRSSTPP